MDELRCKFGELAKLKDEFGELDKLSCKFDELDKLDEMSKFKKIKAKLTELICFNGQLWQLT